VIRVEARAGAYEVHCRWGALDDAGSLMREAGLSGDAFVIADQDVATLFAARLESSLRGAGFTPHVFVFPSGESSKSLHTVQTAYDWLLELRAERSSPIVALGGGVTGDLAGFVAATYLRGVPFVGVPTSLLAMADASIGGKVGVDHARGKNLIGAFYPPRMVIQDTSLLTSLPARQVRSGFGEIIKHGLILDPPMLDLLESESERLLRLDPEIITDVVARNAALKASVVSDDEREGGRRMILNYGHTTAHAIEAVTQYASVMHGEADSVGMMAAAEIGRRVGVTPGSVGERQRALFERYGLPLTMPGLDPDAVIAAMAHDKKVSGKRIRWVLLEDLGRPVVRDDVTGDIVRAVLVSLLR
jgi:3-dehydroquinate synthase